MWNENDEVILTCLDVSSEALIKIQTLKQILKRVKRKRRLVFKGTYSQLFC